MATAKQHVVSVVLLKRFAASDGMLLVEDIRYPHATPKRRSPRSVGYVPNYVQARADEAEALWKTVEDRLHDAFVELDHGLEVPSGSQTEKAVVDCVALHWARSKVVREHADGLRESAILESRAALRAEPATLRGAFYSRYGLHAAGSEALEHMNDYLHGSLVVNQPDFFAGQVMHHFRWAQELLSGRHLQLGDCPRGAPDLILSDAPVITVAEGRTGLNPQGGIALGDATGVAMPLGPRVAVSIHRRPERVQLTDAFITWFNTAQQATAQDHVFRVG